MRTWIAATAATAAIWAGIASSSDAQIKSDTPAAAQPPGPAAAAQVPVKQVVLFSSGVGYFEHFGTVTGEGTTELRFKTQQINDVLKSLVLQDLDNGRVSSVTYPSQDPLAKTLKSFQIDLTSNPSLHDILEQLRGSDVALIVGAETLDGTVLGVEKKNRPAGDKDDKKVVEVWYLNLLSVGGIRQISVDEVRDVRIKDAQLQDELHKALAALAQARDQDKKPVSIRFSGQGDRRVRIGYVVESPVWKTSYRLLLDGPPVGGAEKDKKDSSAKAANPPGGGGAAGAAGVGGKLQGWAIVENQTESDWNDVQLTLVSGRPISFIQDLYQPLYVPRPVVKPELYASLQPQTYEGGMANKQEMAEQKARDDGQDEGRSMSRLSKKSSAARGSVVAPGAPAPAAMPMSLAAEPPPPMDAAASVVSAASASKLGELFQYTVGSVSLPRQKSAMIPIITDPIEVERLSIYNIGVLAKHPLYGARVKNTTGKHLLQGPVTVLQGGSYAGDARVEDLPPGQERLISYGIDLQVAMQAKNDKQEDAVLTGSIVKGVLHLKRKIDASQDYIAENKGDDAKTLVIEQPRRGGEWKLIEPAKADETTDALYRFRETIEPNKPKTMTVREELVMSEQMEILPMDVGQVLAYVRTGPIPKPVRDALDKAAQLKQQMAQTEWQVAQDQRKVQQISTDQSRMRENLKAAPAKSDYYNRLLTKLNDQETQIDTLQKGILDQQQQFEKRKKELEDYLSTLTVG